MLDHQDMEVIKDVMLHEHQKIKGIKYSHQLAITIK